eukprot:scaffold7355_cov497-Prasinococcus_capsulatus_cf.AAC.2
MAAPPILRAATDDALLPGRTLEVHTSCCLRRSLPSPILACHERCNETSSVGGSCAACERKEDKDCRDMGRTRARDDEGVGGAAVERAVLWQAVAPQLGAAGEGVHEEKKQNGAEEGT